MSRGTIDSMDEGLARIVLDDGGICRLPADALPRGAKEGDRLRLTVQLLPEETARAHKAMAAKRAGLSAADDEGDIEL